jgi:hypothetical protein
MSQGSDSASSAKFNPPKLHTKGFDIAKNLARLQTPFFSFLNATSLEEDDLLAEVCFDCTLH